jgi:hypothetical protein
MCIHGIFRGDLGIYYFQRRETTRFKKIQTIINMPPQSITYSSIQWYGIIL